MLEGLKHKNILILGFGREGKDSLTALRKLFPHKKIGIADEKNLSRKIRDKRNLDLYFGKNYLEAIRKYDVIIRTPGIPLRKVKPYLGTQMLTSQIELFLKNCPGTVIGVTGTKGKGTCASLIYKILKKAGAPVRLVGNIGQPVLNILLNAKPDEIFVCELSSHQMQEIKVSPHIAVFLDIYPAHLDHFASFSEYKKAKENIALFQKKSDFFVYNRDQAALRNLAKRTRAQLIPFGKKDLEELYGIIPKEEIPLMGKFNKLNALAAVKTARLLNVLDKDIYQAIKRFKPLPHRLEYIGRFKNIKFYNDSLATVPDATIAVLDGIDEKIDTLITGGSDNLVPMEKLAKNILEHQIKNLIIFPGTGEKVWEKILQITATHKNKFKLPRHFFVYSMEDAVKTAFSRTKNGGICLLSPSAPSFNLFKDYRDRGNQFKKYVKYYGKKRDS